MYNKINQLKVCIYPLPVGPPSHRTPTQPHWVITELGAELPALYRSFPLALCFTHGSMYTCQCCFLSSSHPLHPPLGPQVRPLQKSSFLRHVTGAVWEVPAGSWGCGFHTGTRTGERRDCFQMCLHLSAQIWFAKPPWRQGKLAVLSGGAQRDSVTCTSQQVVEERLEFKPGFSKSQAPDGFLPQSAQASSQSRVKVGF